MLSRLFNGKQSCDSRHQIDKCAKDAPLVFLVERDADGNHIISISFDGELLRRDSIVLEPGYQHEVSIQFNEYR